MAAIAVGRRRADSVAALLSSLFNALSASLGADAEALDEPEMLALVDLARSGDRGAGQRLYRQHVGRVFRTVRSMLASDADAEDVTQDAMLAMLTSLDTYSPRSGLRFQAWVMAIAVNTARRRFRRRRPEPTASGVLPDIPDDDADPERDADAARRRAALLGALGELTDRERAVVSLRYGAELNAREAGEILGLEPANVRKILERARDRLGKRIEALLEDDGDLS